jgi:uncharacterized protein
VSPALPSLILFARAPVLGTVKTRLAARLTEPGALALYRAFLDDASRAYGGSPEWTPVLAAEPDPEDPALASLFPPPWRREAQGPGDLGQRLSTAFAREFLRGAPAAVAVGSDHPALSRAFLVEMLARLSLDAPASAIPADDGGYCAIAFSAAAPFREALRDVPWSTDAVLEITHRRLAAEGVRLTLLPPAYDVDRPEDVDRLRRDLARRDPEEPDFPRATARALAELP